MLKKNLAAWLQYSDDNRLALFKRLDGLFKHRDGLHKALAAELKMDKTALSHMKNAVLESKATISKGKPDKAGEGNYRTIVEFLWLKWNRNLLLEDPTAADTTTDLTFAGLLQLASVSHEELTTAKAHFAGTYGVYRFSHHLEGTKVLRGTLELEWIAGTASLTTTESYSLAPPNGKDDDGAKFDRTGHFIFRKQGAFMVSKKKLADDVQFMCFHHIIKRGHSATLDHPSWMEGTVFDWEGTKFYATKVIIVDNDPGMKSEQYVRAIPIEDVPERVRSKLLQPAFTGFPAGQIDPRVLRFSS